MCSAQEWVDRHGSAAPQYNYWVNDQLKYYSGYSGSCAAASMTNGTGWGTCASTTSPMRVCAGHSDTLGNVCNWTGCGYNTANPDEYFGGCNDNLYAGTLCCF